MNSSKKRSIINFCTITLTIVLLLFSSTLSYSILSIDGQDEFDDYISVNEGENYQFKYDILRLNETTENSYLKVYSDRDNNTFINIVEGDIINVKITDIGLILGTIFINVELNIKNRDLKIVKILTVNQEYFAINLDFFWQGVDEMYEFEEDYRDDNIKCKIEYGIFYLEIEYADDFYYEFLKQEIHISESIISLVEMKYKRDISNYSYFGDGSFDHIRIISLDSDPVYGLGKESFFGINISFIALVTEFLIFQVLSILLWGFYLVIKNLRE